MSNALNKLKDGYLALVNWVELAGEWIADNPQKTTWGLVAAGVGYGIAKVLF